MLTLIPGVTKIVGLMLGRRRRRRAIINPTSCQRIMFGDVTEILHNSPPPHWLISVCYSREIPTFFRWVFYQAFFQSPVNARRCIDRCHGNHGDPRDYHNSNQITTNVISQLPCHTLVSQFFTKRVIIIVSRFLPLYIFFFVSTLLAPSKMK